MSAPRALAAALVLAMAAYCATHMRVVSDISSFMPVSQSGELAALSRGLTDSALTRQMVLTVGGAGIEPSVRAARELAESLREHPEVEWLRAGVDDGQLEALYELYFPRRHYFLSDDPGRELPARLSDEGLRRSAERLRAELARPSAPLVARVAAADPLLAFPALLERLTAGVRGIAVRNGAFVDRSGEHAIVLLGTRGSPFESDRQRPLLEAIEREFGRIRAEIGAPLVLESTGVNRFALDIEDGIRGEIVWLMAASTLGVTVLFLAFFRSFRALAIALVPHAVGVLVAASVGLALFGHLNGLAIAFGVSLIGVSIDYSIHLLNHHALAAPGTSPWDVVRRLRPSLLLGGATTVASLAGLAFGNFPGFYQMGVLATVGVAAALGVSLWVVPDLMAERAAPAVSRRSAALLASGVARLRRHRRLLALVPLACVGLGLWGAPRIRWVDDLTALQSASAEVRAETERVRSRITATDPTRFLIAEGETAGEAIAANDRLAARLRGLVARGDLSGFRSLHTFLWSESLQRANLEVLRADPSLPRRLDAAYSAAGFRPDAFAEFAASLRNPPPPLRLADLAGSPVGDGIRPMLLELGATTAVVTQLEGVRRPDAIERAVEDFPGVRFFDQKRFFGEVYGEYRERIVAVVISGCFAVIALLLLRYRAFRPALATALPSFLVAGLLAALAAATGTPTHILHLIGLILVMGMGVDYGIFVWDSAESDEAVGATMQSLLLSAATTIFVFGVLGLSAQPVLAALGRTTAVGIALAFLLAPVSLVLAGPRRRV